MINDLILCYALEGLFSLALLLSSILSLCSSQKKKKGKKKKNPLLTISPHTKWPKVIKEKG